MSMGRRRWAAMVAVLVALAGCSGLRSNAEPDRLYVLRAAPDAGGTPLPGVLIVPRPAVQPGLDTARIALTRPGNQLDYYAGSRWTSTLPRVLTAFAVQSMDGAFATVAAADRGAGPADYELLLTVRHFEAEYADGSGAPKVRVALDGLLVATSPRRVLASFDVDVSEPAARNRMSDIVVAFERAAQAAFEGIRRQAVAAVPPGTRPSAQ
nr:MAG: hypothetical protein DIU62_07215 [Pseudomonadota bacterium]